MCLNLVSEDWDIAIILDACRYDTFNRYYKKFFSSGELEKRLGATGTYEWLLNNFNKYNNHIVYVSAHPAINKSGVKWLKWNPKNKFFKIYEVWRTHWDKKFNTVPPRCVRKVGLRAIKENPNKRIIIHFMQPHHPYRKLSKFKYTNFHKELNSSPPKTKQLNRVFGILISLLRLRRIWWEVRKLLQTKPKSVEDLYFFNFSLKKIREFYEDNFLWVIKEVALLVNKIENRKIIITADHGEAFGEGGDLFHVASFTYNPVIRIVPFFQINNRVNI